MRMTYYIGVVQDKLSAFVVTIELRARDSDEKNSDDNLIVGADVGYG